MQPVFEKLINETSNIVLDKSQEIKLAVTCLLSGGHLLIEDVPGVGKTTLVQTLAKLSGLETKRIQFTVDLLPADILGGQVYNSRDHKFEFHQGPLFTQMVLADELNRASPRTQGALLQAMEENQISLDGKNWPLPEPFFVIATQNPHQQMGTFPLPESQLDRFLMSLELNYASKKTEIELFRSKDSRDKITTLNSILSSAQFVQFKKQVSDVTVSEIIAIYVSDLLDKSRGLKNGSVPLSTRAGIALIKAGKAWAFIEGRNYLKPEDIQAVAISVLSHRLGGNHGRKSGREWAKELLRETSVPI
ncbi:MAG: AAA family ATPase [Bdellovibrionota bacterium]